MTMKFIVCRGMTKYNFAENVEKMDETEDFLCSSLCKLLVMINGEERSFVGGYQYNGEYFHLSLFVRLEETLTPEVERVGFSSALAATYNTTQCRNTEDHYPKFCILWHYITLHWFFFFFFSFMRPFVLKVLFINCLSDFVYASYSHNQPTLVQKFTIFFYISG